jgi:PAS domain S-box-containing protein
MAEPLFLMDQLAGHVKHGDHLCVVCEDPEERLAAATQYIADGLRANEFVMYAADADTTQTLQKKLANLGIDVAAELARGALDFPTAYDAYLNDGKFDPDLMYAEFDRAITAALEAGFTGCRFAGEPVWAIDKAELRPGLLEFEARLNGLFRDRKAAGLCVYDKHAWPAEVVRDILRTHPVAVVGDLVCTRNLYFEKPHAAMPGDSVESQVNWMVSQLRETRTQEARLEVALEAGNLGSWELDLVSDSATRSRRHDQIFGYDQLLPRWGYASFIEHVVSEDRDRVQEAFQHALETGTTWHFDCRIRRAGDGAIRWIEASGRPYPEGARGDQVRRMLGIVADITERKELQQAMQEADRRKNEFLATLAHELRNPLAPILNSLHLLKSARSDAAQFERAHAIIERQAHHLVRLVDDLLDVSRFTSGRINLQQDDLDLRDVLATALEASEPEIAAAGHALVVDLPDSPLVVNGDATRLAQVFLNLLNNAAKYTPSGGRIELRTECLGDLVRVTVCDNGIGIDPEQITSMFQMFVQGPRGSDQAQGGLGVGLSLARQLLQLHGGSISAHSDGEGKGSRFVVTLPLVAGSAGVSPLSPTADEIVPANGERILVVDDNVDAADSLAGCLELLGYQVNTCYTGVSALEAAESFDPQVAVLDIGLPDLDGYELARRLRARKPDVSLVALTGWGQEKDRRLARDAGFDLHQTKPINPTDLVTALKQLEATKAGQSRQLRAQPKKTGVH